MRARQPGLLAHLLYAELLGAVGAHQLRETPDGDSASAGDELQETGPFFVVRLTDKLETNVQRLTPDCQATTYLPEPNYWLAASRVVPINSVSIPVVHVDLLHPTKQQLQLPLIEVLEPLDRHHLVKTIQERLRLLLYPPRHPPLRHQRQVLLLILLSHFLLITVLLQLVMHHLSQNLEIYTIIQLQPALVDVVLLNPHQRIVKLRVDAFYIFHHELLPQHSFVEGHREAGINEPPVVQRHRDEPPYELEVRQVFGVDVRRWVYLEAVVVLVGVLEQTVHGVEGFVRDQEEPLAADPAVVEAFFTFEDDVEPPTQLVRWQPHDRVEGVFEEGLARHLDLDVAREGVALTQKSKRKKRYENFDL